MNDNETRRYDTMLRIRQFGIDNAADFSGVATAQFAVITTEIDNIEAQGAAQASGFGESGQQYEVKGTARENMREEMSDISRTSKSMEYAFDGIADKFQMPRNRNDAELLNTARAFATEAVPYEADFIAYGLDTKFIQDLTAAADAFEATFGPTSAATAEHVAATAEIAECIRRAMVARRILDGIVKNVYAGAVGKLAAWLSASHIEKAPKKKTPTP